MKPQSTESSNKSVEACGQTATVLQNTNKPEVMPNLEQANEGKL